MDDIKVYHLAPRIKTRIWRAMLLPAVLFALLLAVGLLRNPGPVHDPFGLVMTYMPFVVVMGFLVPQYLKAKRTTAEMRLELSSAGLRHVSIQRDQFVPWDEVRWLYIRRDDAGQIKGMMLRTATGITLSPGSFEKPDEIAAFIQSHATSLREPNTLERLVLHPLYRWFVWGGIAAGVGVLYFLRGQAWAEPVGIGLLVAAYLPSILLFRGNMTGSRSQTEFLRTGAGLFTRNLVLWIVVLAVLLVIYNQFGPSK